MLYNMGFEHSGAFALCALIALAILAGRLLQLKPKLQFSLVTSAKSKINFGQLANRLILVMLLLTVILLLAKPYKQSVISKTRELSQHTAIALDLSESMQAVDFAPNRFGFAKRLANQYIAKSPASSFVSLIAFGNEAIIYSPKSRNKPINNFMVNQLQFDAISGTNTSLSLGIAQSINQLKKTKADNKNIIVLTDGSIGSSFIAFDKLVDFANNNKVGINIITLGKSNMVPFVLKNSMGQITRRSIKSDLDSASLKQLCNSTGGIYKHIKNENVTEIQSLIPPKSTLTETYKVYNKKYFTRPLVLVSLLLVMLLFLLSVIKGPLSV